MNFNPAAYAWNTKICPYSYKNSTIHHNKSLSSIARTKGFPSAVPPDLVHDRRVPSLYAYRDSLYAPSVTAGLRPSLLMCRSLATLFGRPFRGDIQHLRCGSGSHHPRLAAPSKVPTPPLHHVFLKYLICSIPVCKYYNQNVPICKGPVAILQFFHLQLSTKA